jgi:LuxR family maltose regulon positive regulatory protein
LVRGLRGYGKTTLVAAWLERQAPEEVAVVWVAAGSQSSEAKSFEEALSESLRAAGMPFDPGPHSGLGGLEAALAKAPREPRFVLVVDNFENVHEESTLRELVDLLANHRQFHLIVCCQGHHPIESLAATVAEIKIIEPNDLLLRPEEIVDLAQVMGISIDLAAAEGVHQAVGGCISLVKLALASVSDATIRPASVEDYLRSQFLNDVGSKSLREHLLHFSLAESVTWPMFRDLSQHPDPGLLLEQMEATGLVARTADGEEVLFTMPSPIRTILRDEYASSSPEATRRSHQRLADWYAAHSSPRHLTCAFHHAVAAKDYGLMDSLWSDNVATMIGADALMVSQSLEALPAEVLSTRPSMQVLREISEIAVADTDANGRRATLRAFADSCSRLVKQHWDTMSARELLILASGYLIELRLLGRLQDAVAFGDRVNTRVTTLTTTERTSKSRLAWFHLQRGLTFSLIDDDASAIRSYRRVWEYATGAGTDFLQAHAAANLALTYAMDGDLPQTREWLERHRGFEHSHWPGSYLVGIGAHVAAGLLALDRLDDDAVRTEVDYLGDGSAASELWPFVAYLHAQSALYCGKAPIALAQLENVLARSEEGERPTRGVAGALMSRARADLLIACGRGEKARELTCSQGPCKRWSRVPSARIRLLSGHSAGIEFDSMIWDAATATRDRQEMLLLAAVESLRLGDSRNATRLADQAFDIYAEKGILKPLAAIAAEDRDELLKLTGRELEPNDAQALAQRAPVYPERLEFVDLSEHERAVLQALSATASRQAIADSLFVSVNTIKTQLASIYQKLGTSSRIETLTKAREHELLPPGPSD